MKKSKTEPTDTLEFTGIKDPIMVAKGIRKHYKSSNWFSSDDIVKAVEGVDIQIPRGQTFGLVGESGCGKTTLGRCLLRLEEPTEGQILFNGTDITELSNRKLKPIRKNIQTVYQDPAASLNPKKRVSSIISEPLKIHNIGTPESRHKRVLELLDEIGLPKEYKNKYPTQLSGGQKQRVSIARALSLNPDFILLDEPTSALDVSVQAQILDLLKSVQEKYNISYLFITHDLTLLSHFSDWIGVMYLGELVEIGKTEQIFTSAKHPYTRALLSSIPTIYEEDKQYKPELISLQGEIPDPSDRPTGCPFHTRCPEALDECKNIEPEFHSVGSTQYSRCHLHDEDDERK